MRGTLIDQGWGHLDPGDIKSVAFTDTAGTVAVDIDSAHMIICTEDCYWRWTTNGGTAADANDMYLPANTPVINVSGPTETYLSAIRVSSSGTIYAGKLVRVEDAT